MLFLGIDQHARQLTVSLRDQHGDVLLARQVSTRPAKVLEFFEQIRNVSARRGDRSPTVVSEIPKANQATSDETATARARVSDGHIEQLGDLQTNAQTVCSLRKKGAF